MNRISILLIAMLAILAQQVSAGFRFDSILSAVANILLPLAILLKLISNYKGTGNILKERG